MDELIQDRRIRKTQKNLKEALAALMLEKNINEISVKELTDHADINRGTFYLHYKDIFDLVEQIENSMLEELEALMDVECLPASIDDLSPCNILENLFKFLKENATMCAALLGSNGDIALLNKVKAVVREKCFRNWRSIFKNEDTVKYNYYYNFVLSGVLGLFDMWYSNGLVETPSEMATLTSSFIIHGIHVLN